MLSSLDLAADNLFLITARKEIDKNNASEVLDKIAEIMAQKF